MRASLTGALNVSTRGERGHSNGEDLRHGNILSGKCSFGFSERLALSTTIITRDDAGVQSVDQADTKRSLSGSKLARFQYRRPPTSFSLATCCLVVGGILPCLPGFVYRGEIYCKLENCYLPLLSSGSAKQAQRERLSVLPPRPDNPPPPNPHRHNLPDSVPRLVVVGTPLVVGNTLRRVPEAGQFAPLGDRSSESYTPHFLRLSRAELGEVTGPKRSRRSLGTAHRVEELRLLALGRDLPAAGSRAEVGGGGGKVGGGGIALSVSGLGTISYFLGGEGGRGIFRCTWRLSFPCSTDCSDTRGISQQSTKAWWLQQRLVPERSLIITVVGPTL